jgi:hypothetical protein
MTGDTNVRKGAKKLSSCIREGKSNEAVRTNDQARPSPPHATGLTTASRGASGPQIVRMSESKNHVKIQCDILHQAKQYEQSNTIGRAWRFELFQVLRRCKLGPQPTSLPQVSCGVCSHRRWLWFLAV